MQNSTHFSLLVLASALFLLGSQQLGAIEQGQLSEDYFILPFSVTTVGLCLFTNSMLTLHRRATVTYELSAVTQNSIEANRKEVEKNV